MIVTHTIISTYPYTYNTPIPMLLNAYITIIHHKTANKCKVTVLKSNHQFHNLYFKKLQSFQIIPIN